MAQIDVEALSEPFDIIQSANGLVLLKSHLSEKFLILDELTETQTLHNDEIYIRDEVYDKLLKDIQSGKEIFITNQEDGELSFNQRAEERAKNETSLDREYREYLNKLKAEVGDDYLDYATPKEAYKTFAQSNDNLTKNTPAYDIHTTYKNDKLYEKNTPLNLRTRQQFVCWKYEWLDGKWKKIPYDPKTGKKASSVSYKTWADFDTACKAVDKYSFDGVGIMFSKGIMGIDIDHCIDKDGNISDNAKEIINCINSYTEYSPSKTGIHILAFGELPGQRTRSGEYEMYCKGRFFTLTGNLYEGKFRKIPRTSETAAAIQLIYNKYINIKRDLFTPNVQPSEAALTYTDEEIISKCRKSRNAEKFDKLWQGDTSLHRNDHSLSDNALCGMIAYYTDDAYQIDRIFRKSGLMRDKWDEYRGEKTYGQITIDSILNSPNRPRYNPKYFYETQIKPRISSNSGEWTTIKLSEENYVQDYPRCKNFKITHGEFAGAIFFYPSSLITKTDEGYNLKVKSDFTFKIRPKGSQNDIELNVGELRSAIAGQPTGKKINQNKITESNQTKRQSEFE